MYNVQLKKMCPEAKMPVRAHDTDSGADLFSLEGTAIWLNATKVLRTGLQVVSIPAGYELQIRSKSGLSSKGVVVANSPGTIDNGYRGELLVILHNTTDAVVVFAPGDKIAQLVVAPVVLDVGFEETDVVAEATTRGTGGLGSTGR